MNYFQALIALSSANARALIALIHFKLVFVEVSDTIERMNPFLMGAALQASGLDVEIP